MPTRKTSHEFEFAGFADPARTCAVLRGAGFAVMHRDRYTRQPPEAGFDYCLELDAPGRNAAHPLELKTHWIGPESWPDVERLLDALERGGATIDHRAAYHVRVEVPDYFDDPARLLSLARLVYQYEWVIYGLVHREAAYMSSVQMPGLQRISECRTREDFLNHAANTTRARGMNITGLGAAIPHIEFRWRGGTLDPAEAQAWTNLMLAMVDYAAGTMHPQRPREANTPEALDAFLSLAGGDPTGRIRKGHTIHPVSPRHRSRDIAPPKPARPSLPARIAAAGASVVKTQVLRIDRVDDESFAARLAVCAACPDAVLKDGKPHRCGPIYAAWKQEGGATCGCLLELKARDKTQACPQGKWPPPVPDEGRL